MVLVRFGLKFFRITWGVTVMKKLYGSSFSWIDSRDKTNAMNTEQFGAPATIGLMKLWRFSMAIILGTLLFALSAPV